MRKSTIVAFILLIVIIIIIILLCFFHLSLYNLYISSFSKDPLTPFLTLNHPSLHRLRANWRIIREEVLQNRKLFSPIRGDLFFEDKIIPDDKWTKIYLKWYDNPPSYSYHLFPKTMALLDQDKNIKLAMFSALAPGARILPHRGPFRGCIRIHLCLVGPNSDDCNMKVDGKQYVWKEGEMVAFDDTYLHSVVNDSQKERIVLFLDVKRRMKFSFLNNIVIRDIAPLTTRINDEI